MFFSMTLYQIYNEVLDSLIIVVSTTCMGDTMMHHEEVLSDDPSSPDSTFDADDLMHHGVHADDVSHQLAASGMYLEMSRSTFMCLCI